MSKVERPKKVRDYEGGYVRTKRVVSTGGGEMPADSIFQITQADIVFSFKGMPCKCCGVAFYYTAKGKIDDKMDGLEWLGFELPEA